MSARSFRQVTWEGSLANVAAASTLDPGVDELVINSPAELSGNLTVGGASFGPGLTPGGLNGEVALTVLDTQNGLTKTYSNELKTPFDPILDTSAFATCP